MRAWVVTPSQSSTLKVTNGMDSGWSPRPGPRNRMRVWVVAPSQASTLKVVNGMDSGWSPRPVPRNRMQLCNLCQNNDCKFHRTFPIDFYFLGTQNSVRFVVLLDVFFCDALSLSASMLAGFFVTSLDFHCFYQST